MNLGLALVAAKREDLEAFLRAFESRRFDDATSLGRLVRLRDALAGVEAHWTDGTPHALLGDAEQVERLREVCLVRRLGPAVAQAVHLAAIVEVS